MDKVSGHTAPDGVKVDFNARIQPLLVKHCSPCHFPGGKLYEKLPFDQEITLLSHQKGILKRFKDEAELSLLRQYIEQGEEIK